VLGAIIAGGKSVRYGSPKALARFAGERLVDRVARALGEAADELVVIANDPALAAEIGLPWRADELTGIGSLAGLHAALRWAGERGCDGVLAAGADMPLLAAALLSRLRARGAEGWDAVLPESEGPRGLEPLCAYYALACITPIERATARGDARLIGFHDEVRVLRLPLAEVRSFGDPRILFTNINTTAEHAQLERLVLEGRA